jgi:hypothetical protein
MNDPATTDHLELRIGEFNDLFFDLFDNFDDLVHGVPPAVEW